MKSLSPDGFAGDIYNLDQKLGLLESLGVKLTVLIDFSGEFSKISGRGFIDLLLNSQPVTLLALGEDFSCGHGRDAGVEEIRSIASARGVETWAAPPVMDGGRPISSNRIRQALADGRLQEAERMLGRPLDPVTLNNIVPK
jgi:riboflavin kinase/FMN adenylyltransferase